LVPVPADAASPETLAWYAARAGSRDGFGSNEDAVLPAASVIKLLIALTLIDESRAGRFDLLDHVALSGSDRVAGSDRFGKARARRYPAAELIDAMLSLSDNTASNALLRFTGIPRCNDVASAHGLRRTRIRRSFYDWAAQRRGLENETTARESAELMLLIGTGATERGAASAVARAVMSALVTQTDRETIPAALPNRRSVANKTGELPGVRNDVALVDYRQSGAYVISVMDRYGGSGRPAAVESVRRIARMVDRRFAGEAGTPRQGGMHKAPVLGGGRGGR
jgi:beta-lactamase class A